MSKEAGPSTVRPSDHGGVGRTSTLHYQTICPPDIRRGTRIVGVCGINDDADDMGNPDQDGWFFSDFFLFHHLLRGASSDQVWLSCNSPASLITKYTRFLHGHPERERKVVLDASMLPEVEDVRVVSCARDSGALLERFLATVRDESRKAHENDQRLLLLVFSHGKDYTHAILMGGKQSHSDHGMLLTKGSFRRAIHPRALVTLLTTACFSGGWALAEDHNTTVLAATTPEDESLSWPVSASLRRACGGKYASTIARHLIADNIAHESSEALEDSLQEEPTATTYAALTQRVWETLKQEVDEAEPKPISFSAQDEAWGMEWRSRTGIPLAEYKNRWDVLASWPAGRAGQSGSSMNGRLYRRDPTMDASHRRLWAETRHLVALYLKSFPGFDNAGWNVAIHNSCHAFMVGEAISKEKLERLHSSIEHRLKEVMAVATTIKDRWCHDYPDCEQYDSDTRHHQETISKEPERYKAIYGMVRSARVFDTRYSKGVYYLSHLIYDLGWGPNIAQAKLDGIKKAVRVLSPTWYTMKSLGLKRKRGEREILRDFAHQSHKQLKSLSPMKRGSLQGVFERRDVNRSYG